MDPWNQPGNWWDQNHSGFFGALSSPQSQPSSGGGFFGRIGGAVKDVGHAVEQGAKDVGGFFGGMVSGTVNDARTAVTTVKDIGGSLITNTESNKKINALNQQSHDLNQQYQQGKISLKDYNAQAKSIAGQRNQIGQALKKEGVNKLNPAKSAAATASTFLNLATLGAGGAVAAGVKEGAQVAAKTGLADLAGYAGKKIAENAGEGALFGGAYGAISPITQKGSNATPSDILHSALVGGVAGGVSGAAGSLLDKNVRAGVTEIPGALRKANTALGDTGGGRPFAGLLDSTQQQLAGNSIAHPEDIAQSEAAQYKSPAQYITDIAKQALETEKAKRGGIQVPGTDGGTIRSTEHAPWYTQYYSEYGKAPSLQATKDIVEEGLKTGAGVDGAVYPEQSQVYQLLQDREQGLQQTAAQGPQVDLAHQYQADLVGAPKPSPETAPEPQAKLKLGRTQGVGKLPPSPEAPNVAPESFPANQRGFFRNMQTADTTTPEVKAAIKAEPQTYEPANNPDLVRQAQQIVESNPDTAYRRVIDAPRLSDEDVAVGHQLIAKAQREGRINDAVAIAENLDTKLRESGRAVQAASIWGRLSPEGVLRMAANKYAKAREGISAGRGFGKGVGAENKVAQDIKDTVEGTGKLDTGTVQRAVQDTADSLPKEQPTVGEQVASNVERAVSPATKKKADLLVKEITKKVKQEMIAQKTKTPKSATDILREVFSRNQEAQDAFPEAKRILMERAQDKPAMQAALDKFFNSELGLPASSTTINSAIKEQLVKNKTKISDIIQKSWNGQTQSIEAVSKALVKEGFDKESADTMATEVGNRLKAQTVMAKQRALQNLSREAPKRAQASFLDKVSKLSNLGALDNHDYLELARSKLKLPQLTEEVGRKVSALAQNMQDLPPGAERDAIGRQIYRTINESIPKTKAQIAGEVISAPKAIMASYDLSSTLRQGGVLGSRFPAEAKDSFAKQVKYFKSADAYDKGMSAIKQDPAYDLASKAKIALTGVEGGEEAFVSQLPEKIPVFGKGIQASDRAYTGALTELRFNSFKHIMNDLKAAGTDPNSLSDEQLQSIGKFINTASGRGYGPTGGLFEKVAPALNRTLFSPRLWKSRLDMLNPAYYYKLDPIARKYALQSAGSFAGIAATVLGLASLAGAQVGTDPRSSDFLKIKVGDTRYDILGGFQQNLVFAWREISGQKVNSSTGEVQSLTSGKFGSTNRLSILSDLISNKENPVISAGGNILKGTDATGQPVNPAAEIGQLFVPLNIQDTYTAAKSENPLTAAFKATVPGTLGVGVNTYAPQVPKSNSQYSSYFNSLAGKNPW